MVEHHVFLIHTHVISWLRVDRPGLFQGCQEIPSAQQEANAPSASPEQFQTDLLNQLLQDATCSGEGSNNLYVI